MHNREEITFVVKKLNELKQGKLKRFEFVRIVCNFFDKIKKENFTVNDLKFLKFVANQSGVPLFYKMLKNFQKKLQLDGWNNIDLVTFSSFFYESTLFATEQSNIPLHRYQKEILDRFIPNQINRFLLTASTSFGKTFLIYELIRKMKYENILLIFPSIALLSENLDKILRLKDYQDVRDRYSIHTLSDSSGINEKNIFIYTPERYLSFLEKENNKEIKFDFVFVDEIYKIDDEFEQNEEDDENNQLKENERDVAYRLTTHFIKNRTRDILLAGPYIDVSDASLQEFMRRFQITHLNYNECEIVGKSLFRRKKGVFVGDNDVDRRSFNCKNAKNKGDVLKSIVKSLRDNHENAIIYTPNRGKKNGAEYCAEILLSTPQLKTWDYTAYSDLMDHIEDKFSKDWLLYKALKIGVGIHHGMIPKYIQKEVVDLFNQGKLDFLISTTTITEGVNTSAKFLIVTNEKKGNKPLKAFDAKNIAGRAGRLGYHYCGNVIDLTNDLFTQLLKEKGDSLKHKNYDKESIKNNIDLQFTDKDFLSDNDIIRKNDMARRQFEKKIPEAILNQFYMVSWNDKFLLFDAISKLSNVDIFFIDNSIQQSYQRKFYKDGFQIMFDILKPIISNKELKGMVERKDKNNKYSIVLHYMSTFFFSGFRGLVSMNMQKRGTSYDKSINKASKFVLSTLKYQIVKYLGAFNLMYKYVRSCQLNKDVNDIDGLDQILCLFEYNALTNEGRIASDYGVSQKIIDYYENDKSGAILNTFDSYEMKLFEKVKRIVRE